MEASGATETLDKYFNTLLSDQQKYIEYSRYNPQNAIFSPVHINRMIGSVCSKFQVSNTSLSDLSPIHAVKCITTLLSDIREKTPFENCMFEILLRHHLNPVIIS